MKGLITTFCGVLFLFGLKAQTTEDLEAYYTFNDSTAFNEILNSGIDIGGNLEFVCGIERLAILFDGGSDEIVYLSPEAGLLLDDDDFTIGFFMSPAERVGTQTIFSKKEACNDDNAFAVRYTSSSQTVTVELSENSSKKVVLTAQVDLDKCWQHITIVRSGATARLYLNGILKDSGSTLSRISLLRIRPFFSATMYKLISEIPAQQIFPGFLILTLVIHLQESHLSALLRLQCIMSNLRIMFLVV